MAINKDDNEEIKQQKLIGYEPELTYVDEYWSDIDYENEEDSGSGNIFDNGDKETIDKLLENLLNLQFSISKLPQPFADAFKEVIDQVVDFAEDELDGKEYHEHIHSDDDWIYGDDSNNNGDGDNNNNGGGTNRPDDGGSGHEDNTDGNNGWDEEDNNGTEEEGSDDGHSTSGDSMWGSDDFFPTIEVPDTKEEIYKKEYVKNLTELLKFYYTEGNKTVMQFWRDYIIATSKKDFSEVKFMLDIMKFSSNRVNSDLKHLFDTALRQDVCKNMKLQYHLLSYNAEETLLYLKQFKAIQETRLRYAKIDKLDGSTRENDYSNKVLNASLIAYNKKYDIAFANLYRYLHNSNKIMKDTLGTWIQEIKSKQILVEKKGIK